MYKKIMIMVIAAMLTVMLTACRNNNEKAEFIPSDPEKETFEKYAENILTAEVESEDEAIAIAEKCGIVLEEWSGGLALYYTEEDLDVVIKRAEDQGIYVLKKNIKMELY